MVAILLVVLALAARIGNWSYAIYPGHLLTISAPTHLLPDSLWSLLFYLIALAARITLGWLTHIAVEMPLLKAGRRLIDRHAPPPRDRADD
jgi:peptidoglycan/LPS O-acetylase OafA/YrhL